MFNIQFLGHFYFSPSKEKKNTSIFHKQILSILFFFKNKEHNCYLFIVVLLLRINFFQHITHKEDEQKIL
jgi:hypothetical protein